MVTLAGIGSVLGGLGGLFGRKKSSSTLVNYKWIRQKAAENGFNPLTALRNGGSANSTTIHPGVLSPGAVEAIGEGLETAFNGPKLDRDGQAQDLRVQILQEELKAQKARNAKLGARESFGYSIPAIVESAGKPKPPPLSPTGPKVIAPPDPDARVRVRLPDGTDGSMLKSTAQRLGVKENDQLTAGEYTDIVGEIIGEAGVLSGAAGISDSQLRRSIWTGGSTEKKVPPKLAVSKARKARRPKPKYGQKAKPSGGSAGRRKRRGSS
jgi:hypothetical protein